MHKKSANCQTISARISNIIYITSRLILVDSDFPSPAAINMLGMIAHGGFIAQQACRNGEREIKNVTKAFTADQVAVFHYRRINVFSPAHVLPEIPGQT